MVQSERRCIYRSADSCLETMRKGGEVSYGMPRQAYPSDLIDAQWAALGPLLPPPKAGGRTRTVDPREVVNGLLYVLCLGCPWRSILHDFPPWSTVWSYFRQWRDDCSLDRPHDQLREQVRQQAGHHPQPTAVILDRQSAQTTEKGGHAVSMLARRLRDANAILSSIPWD